MHGQLGALSEYCSGVYTRQVKHFEALREKERAIKHMESQGVRPLSEGAIKR
jgi:hypothetical protein